MSLRLDRLATLYLVSPLMRVLPAYGPSIPILMYHSISDGDGSNAHPYYRTKTSPAMFAAQMKQLRDSGYRTCSPAQAMRQLQAKTADKLVVITFDDGYRDFYHQAFPVLNRYGFSATVYLPTAYIGDSPSWFKGTECMTWAEVWELSQHGIFFGSHTVNHPRLLDLTRSAVNEELTNSRHTIEDKLGCAVDSFACPYAFPHADTDFKKMLRDSLSQAGYRNGVCTIVGRVNQDSEPLFMKRLPVNTCDDAALFLAKLAGAYDWVGAAQYVSKMVGTRWRSSAVGAKGSVVKDFRSVH